MTKLLAAIWKAVNLPFSSAALLGLVAFLYAQWAGDRAREEARHSQALHLRVELDERLRDTCDLGDDDFKPADLKRIVEMFTRTDARTRPEFAGVSTYALYVDWCDLDPGRCVVVPAELHLAVRTVRARWERASQGEELSGTAVSSSLLRDAYAVVRRASCNSLWTIVPRRMAMFKFFKALVAPDAAGPDARKGTAPAPTSTLTVTTPSAPE